MLKFNTTVKMVPVEMDNAGTIEHFEIREMKASARDSYLDSIRERMAIDAKGNATIVKFDGMQASLLSRCFFRQGATTPVETSVIQELPASVVGELFTEAQKLNMLNVDKPAMQEAKNG